MSPNIKFNNANRKDFYVTLKSRVEAYFTDNKIPTTANTEMVLKTVFILASTVGIYLFLILGNYSLPVMFALWAVLGFFTALIGLNICHDAIHGSYSKNQKLNKTLGYVFNVVGANAYNWNMSHNIVHHSFTNIDGHDEDIDFGVIVRLSPGQKRYGFHKFQHFYTFFFYALATLHWVFAKDFIKFFKGQIGNMPHKKHPVGEYFNLFLFKALYYSLYIVLPIVMIDFAWWQILLGFVVMHLVEGLTLSLIFQLAHVIEGTDYPKPDEKGRIENSWAVHQLYTTANFACGNRAVNFIAGGLNFQVEHHLFPKICHTHYRPVSKIVEDTAKEFGLPYIHYPTFTGAIAAHARMLKKLGNEDAPATAIWQTQAQEQAKVA